MSELNHLSHPEQDALLESDESPAIVQGKTIEKVLHFYRLVPTYRRDIDPGTLHVDWAAKIEETKTQSALMAFEASGAAYDVAFKDGGCVLLGRRISENAVAKFGAEVGFTPVANDDATSYLARINVGVFTSTNMFGIIGSKDAPGLPAMVGLANALRPVPDGRWEHRPLMVDPELALFERVGGVSRVEFAGPWMAQGLTDTSSKSMGFEMLPELLGLDGSVEVTLTVAAKEGGPTLQRAMKTVAEKLRRGPHRKLRVKPVDPEFDVEFINLVSHRLTSKVSIQTTSNPDDICAAVAAEVSALADTLDRAGKAFAESGH